MTLTDLTFTQEEGSGLHVCEFVAQGPMFLHVERVQEAEFVCYQSLTGTGWVPFLTLPKTVNNQKNLDFQVPNTPSGMHIRITSVSEVLVAKVGYESW